MFVPRASGLHGLVKDGAKHLTGLDEAVLRNVEACKKFTEITRTSYGVNGLKKLVINKHGRLMVTSDAATIIQEIEVEHPAAKILVMASKMQESEYGDATNAVVMLGGELLGGAEALIRMGLHPSEIVAGYTLAGRKALELITKQVVETVSTLDESSAQKVLRAVVATKVQGFEDKLVPLLAKACVQVYRAGEGFRPERVRVCKVLGGGVGDARLFHGLVLAQDSLGSIKHCSSAKVVVFSAGFDFAKTEAKASVVLHSGKELEDFSLSEERNIEAAVKEVAATGVKVVVSGGTVGELALHFLEKHGLMVVKIQSKFDLRRVCEATGAVPLVRLGAPTAEEMGYCDIVSIEEVGSTKVCIFRAENETDHISTLVLRASTTNVLEDLERAVDDAVQSFRVVTKHGELLPGAGAFEVEIARLLRAYGDSLPGMEQYAVRKFAEALEVFPRTLAENSGVPAAAVISRLFAAHEAGDAAAGVNVADGSVKSAIDMGVFDLLATRRSAMRLAVDAAVDILRIDQLIMARKAGGPVLPKGYGRDTDA